MPGSAPVLVVATQPLAAVVRDALERVRLDVAVHEGGPGALRAVFGTQPPLVVIEDGLGDSNGMDLLLGLGMLGDIPAIVMGHDQSERAAVAALERGADRYMSLPLRVDELGATARAILRRTHPASVAPPTYADGTLEVDFETFNVRVRGVDVQLTPVEFRVLAAFVNNVGQTLTPEEILETAWGHSDLPRGRVKLYIGYLRRKFRRVGVDLEIETVRGFGYRYSPSPTELNRELGSLFAPLEDLRGPSGQPFFPSEAARRELAEALGHS
jgi:DNA-binding response OmpR family regulator